MQKHQNDRLGTYNSFKVNKISAALEMVDKVWKPVA